MKFPLKIKFKLQMTCVAIFDKPLTTIGESIPNRVACIYLLISKSGNVSAAVGIVGSVGTTSFSSFLP